MNNNINLSNSDHIPTETYSSIDPERQKLVETVFGLAYALIWLFSGWAVNLRSGLVGFTTNPWLVLPFFVAVFGGFYLLLDLPLSYITGFILPHRFSQSNQTLKGWITDQVKGLLIGIPLGGGSGGGFGQLGEFSFFLFYW